MSVSSKGLFCIIAFMMLQFSCTPAARIVREASSPTKPGWLEKPMQESEKLYFVGIDSTADTLEEGQQGAYKDALDKISSYLGIRIESSFSSYISEEERDINQEISSKSSSLVKGAKVEDSYYEKLVRTENNLRTENYDVYVLVSFSKREALKESNRQKKEKKDKVKIAYDSLLKGMAKEKRQSYYDARKFYTQGLKLIADIEDIVGLENGAIKSSKELELKLETALEDINIKLSQVALSVKVKGSSKAKQLFNSSLAAGLYDKGFTVTNKTAAIKIVGNVSVSKGGFVMDNHFYYANGSVSAKRGSDGHVLAVYPLKVKGFHRSPDQAAMKALENAGGEAGNALAEMILQEGSGTEE